MSRFDHIGNTPLIRLNELGGKPLEAEVLIKDESANPTGTHKDRKSAFLIKRALEEGIDTLAILTAGNAGYSLATLAQGTGIEVVTIVSNSIRPKIKQSLSNAGATIEEVDFSVPLTSEDISNLARTSLHQNIWDVTNEGHEAYQEIYHEIAGENADLILCPVGSGELYLGLIEGLQISKNTHARVMGLFPRKTSDSKADKLCSDFLPLENEIRRQQLNVAPSPETGIEYSHCLGSSSEEEIQWGIDNKPIDLLAEPSSLISLYMIKRMGWVKDLKMIMLNTGKGMAEI